MENQITKQANKFEETSYLDHPEERYAEENKAMMNHQIAIVQISSRSYLLVNMAIRDGNPGNIMMSVDADGNESLTKLNKASHGKKYFGKVESVKTKL